MTSDLSQDTPVTPSDVTGVSSLRRFPVFPVSDARLKIRREFLFVADAGRKAIASTVIVQGREVREGGAGVKIGFTVTKKTGNSVIRNRIRRRLRAAVAQVVEESAQPGWDYVVIGRPAALDASFDVLLRDLRYALKKVVKSPHGEKREPEGRGKK